MKTLTMLLAAYFVISGTTTSTHWMVERKDSNHDSRIACGNDKENCNDLAEALNEARDRRLHRDNYWFIGTGTITWPANWWDSNTVLPVRPINCHKRCGSDEDCRTAPTVCE